MSNTIGWSFPSTNWGTENGKNDPGLETFRGNPYPALAREPIQNSLDARLNTTKPVYVEFSSFTIPNSQFPGRDGYVKTLEQCKASSRNGSETEQDIFVSLETINSPEIRFIKISDYNTTGLPGSDKLRDSDWHRLIKVVGDSDKGDTSGGAFGIGKHAPFVCSKLKAVFYSTKDIEGNTAFQGVAKLVTFLDNEGEPRQATGFYGEKFKIQPVKDIAFIPKIFRRNKVGTDVFVAGFDYRNTWQEEITEAVITSFFVAIHEGHLQVKVGENIITHESLGGFIEDMKSKGSKNKVIHYYDVMVSTKPFVIEDFEGLGKIELYIQNDRLYHKKIAMVRKTGMLIKERQNYNLPEKYAGVLLIKGDAFNRELKRIENPTHTDWEFKRKENTTEIRQALEKLYKWMNEKIKEISPLSELTTIEVDELAQFLPDFESGSPFENEASAGNSNLEEQTEQPSITRKKTFPKFDGGKKITEESDGDPVPGKPGRKAPGNPGKIFDPKIKEDKGKERKKGKLAQVAGYKLFCIKPDEGGYKLNLNIRRPGELKLNFIVIGEDSNLPALIASAKMDGLSVPVSENSVGPLYFSEGKNSLFIELNEKIRVAMGVDFNAE